MNTTRVTLLCAALFVLAASPHALADASAKKRARTLFSEANGFFARGMYLDALKKYRQARALYPSFKIDLNIGGTLDAMGRPTEAASYYEKFMLNAGRANPAVIKEAKNRLAALQKKLGRVRVTCLEGEAKVLVNGKAVGKTPLDLPVYLLPGSYALVAQKAGFVGEQKKVTLAAGDSREVDLPLSTRSASAPTPAAGPSTTPADPGATTPTQPSTTPAAVPTGEPTGDPTVNYYKGLALKKKGRTDQAMAEFAEALRKNPTFAPAHHSIGILYRKKRKVKQAIHHLEIAAKLRPDYAETRYILALSYYMAKRRDDALASFVQAARLDPKDPRPHEQAGVLLARRDPNKAVAHFEAAARLDPKNVSVLRRLGTTYIKLKKLDLAKKTLLRAEKVKLTGDVAFSLGLLHRTEGNTQKAADYYKKAIKLAPKTAAAYWNLAKIYAEQGKKDEATSVYSALIKIDDKSSAAARARRAIIELKGR